MSTYQRELQLLADVSEVPTAGHRRGPIYESPAVMVCRERCLLRASARRTRKKSTKRAPPTRAAKWTSSTSPATCK